MKDKILDAIKLQSGKITFKKLHKKFNIDEEDLRNLLLELKLDGMILQLGNKYMIFPDDLHLGVVMNSSTGNKYISYEDKKLPIPSNFLNDVIFNDIVSFKFVDGEKIEVVSIVDRPLGLMTCTVESINGKKAIVPYRNGLSITLPIEDMDNLSIGDIFLVNMEPNELGEHCNATFVKKIGRVDDPNKDDEIFAINYGFDNFYSEAYMEELSKIPTTVLPNELIGRRDFRRQKSCTIDGKNTKDMDDGVFAEIIENGKIRLYIHIADVSHYVKYGSEIFKRACKVTTSLYTNNSVFHMLHYIISNGICSLNPNVDRLTKTVILDIDENGEIVDFNIVKSVINSKKKMTYEEVDEILVNNKIPSGYEDFVGELLLLKEAATRLEKRYNRNGKISFANNEMDKTYNGDGTLYSLDYLGDTPARKIIEYLMIAANESVAQWLLNMGIPAIYRIHESPDIKKINAIIDQINASGKFNIRHVTNVDTPKNIQRILDRVKNSGQFPLISQMFVQGMMRAGYSVYNIGHYALGLDAYLHFTSPIRRIADLVVHMIVDLVLEDYDKLMEYDLVELEKQLEKLAVRATIMERRSAMAELDSEKFAIINYMEKFIGEEMEAVVCDIGKEIKIRINGIDSYIKLKDFSDGFIFDKKRKRMCEISTGRLVKLGTKLRVKLTGVCTANGTVRVNVLHTVCDNIMEDNISKKRIKKRNAIA